MLLVLHCMLGSEVKILLYLPKHVSHIALMFPHNLKPLINILQLLKDRRTAEYPLPYGNHCLVVTLALDVEGAEDVVVGVALDQLADHLFCVGGVQVDLVLSEADVGAG
jgi:hypothetical protein